MLTDTEIVIWVTILNFSFKNYKNDHDVICAGVSTKQACSLTSGKYDL